MRKLNHQFEAQVWYDPDVKYPPLGQTVLAVIETPDTDYETMRIYLRNIRREEDEYGEPYFVTEDGSAINLNWYKILAWTAWSPEYLFEPVDVHQPIRGIVKETNRGGENTWN